MEPSKTVIAISGPTAIGKTSLAIKIASYFSTEIISVDSRQFYKEMSIGTAVPEPEELAAVQHHFIQHKSIHDTYNVGDFEKEAIKKIEKLFKKHNILILVGGSGLYMDAIIKGLDSFPKINPEIREKLNELLEKEGITPLQEQLKELDPAYYEKVDLYNPQRLIRALEVCLQSQKPYSSFLEKKKPPRDFKVIHLALNAPREIIYQRINYRVDLMMKAGLLNEVSGLQQHKNLNALQTVGYKELFKYLSGEYPLDFAVSEIKKNTRRFAKRQLTWLRRDETIKWFDYKTPVNEIILYLKDRMNKSVPGTETT